MTDTETGDPEAGVGWRSAVTIGVVLLVALCTHIPLANVEWVGWALRDTVPSLIDWYVWPPPAEVSLLAVGLRPFLVAALVVEAVAAASPRFRFLRRSGPTGRRRLSRAALLLTGPLAATQAVLISRSLSDWPIAPLPPAWWLLSTSLTLLAGTALVLFLADVVDRWGLGGGIATVLAAPLVRYAWGALPEIGKDLAETLLDWNDPGTEPGALVLAVAGLAVVGLLRATRPGRPPLPLGGLVPPVLGAIAAVWAMNLLGIDLLGRLPRAWLGLAQWPWVTPEVGYSLPFLGLVVGLSIALGRLFNGRGNPDGQLRSALGLGFIAGALGLLGAHPSGPWRGFGPGLILPLGILLGWAMDVIAEWRARQHTDLWPLWPLESLAALPAAQAALNGAGIPHHVRGRYFRAVFCVFAPWAPAVVCVPAARMGEAARLLAAVRPSDGPPPNRA